MSSWALSWMESSSSTHFSMSPTRSLTCAKPSSRADTRASRPCSSCLGCCSSLLTAATSVLHQANSSPRIPAWVQEYEGSFCTVTKFPGTLIGKVMHIAYILNRLQQ